MSEMTTEEVLALIEECAAEGKTVDLSGKDLSGIDLSSAAIEEELNKRQQIDADTKPPWLWEAPAARGVNLSHAN